MLGVYAHWPDVDIVLPGHGPITDKENFLHQRRYIKALRDEVLEGMIAGHSLQHIRDTVTMDDFSDYGSFETYLDANIVTMWGYLYRYREPNSRITPEEAVKCQLDVTQCRTSELQP